MIPAALALAAFGRPVVSLLFERGRFDARDTSAVTWVLAAYAIGLLAYGSVRLFATAFYATQDTRTPVRAAVAALILNVALGILLAWQLGTPGIALATAAAAVANGCLLGGILKRRLGRLFGGSSFRDTIRMAAAAAAPERSAIVPYIWMLSRWMGWALPRESRRHDRALCSHRSRLRGGRACIRNRGLERLWDSVRRPSRAPGQAETQEEPMP